MFLDLSNEHLDYDKDIWPYIKNGIIIDTSVLKIIIDGLVSVRISKKKSSELEKLLAFIDLIKFKDKWNKFYITPHIFTETCTHLRNDYNKHGKYTDIIGEVFPIMKEMDEKMITKQQIFSLINPDRPIVELGDISIFAVADDFVSRNENIAILVKDMGINTRYAENKKVMILDYISIINNAM